MGDILILQELVSASQVGSAHKLSERNCVDVILKLQEQGKLQVFNTKSNFREFVTPKQLGKEILEQLTLNGGRVSLDELTANINIDIVEIEGKIKELLAFKKDMSLIGQYLIEDRYFDNLLDELKDDLSSCGFVSIAEVATKKDLPIEAVKNFVEDRLRKLNAELRQSIIYTQDFLERQRAMIRGFLGGSSRPTLISTYAAKYNLPEDLVLETAKDLCRDKKVAAVVKGGEFIPSIFSSSQRSSVDAFFLSNGYISYDRMAKLRVKQNDALDFIKKSNPNVRSLDSLIIGQSFTDRIAGQIQEVIRSRSWLDVSVDLPVDFTEDDIEMLLSSYSEITSEWNFDEKSKKKSKFVCVSNSYIFSYGFLDDLIPPFIKCAKDEAKIAGNKKVNVGVGEEKKAKENEKRDNKKEKEKEKDIKKGKTKKGKRKGDDSEEEEEEKEEKGKKGSKKEKKKAEEAVSFDKSQCATILTSLHPIILQEKDGEVVESLVEIIYNSIYEVYVDNYNQFIAKLFQGLAEERRKAFVAFEHYFEKAWVTLQLSINGLDLFKSEEKKDEGDTDVEGISILTTFISDQLCLPLTANLLHFYIFQYIVNDSGKMPSIESIQTSPEIRNALVQSIVDSDVQQIFQKLFQHVRNRNLPVFIATILSSTGSLNIRALPLDRKSEKNILFSRKHDLNEAVGVSSISPIEILKYTVLITFLQVKGGSLFLPEVKYEEGLNVILKRVSLLIHISHSEKLLTLNDRIKLINTDGMDVEEMEDVEKKELADMIKCVKEIAFMTKEVLIKGKEGI